MTSEIPPEFSRVVRPSALVADPSARELEIEASPAECAALAARFGFLAIDYFRASVRLRPLRGSVDFHLAGHISARIAQSCVVTLDPVTSEIEHDFNVILCEETADEERLAEMEDDVELYSRDAIDIGEVVAVELALSVDPYPRAPGVSGEMPGESDGTGAANAEGEPRTNRPFEALATLKRPK